MPRGQQLLDTTEMDLLFPNMDVEQVLETKDRLTNLKAFLTAGGVEVSIPVLECLCHWDPIIEATDGIWEYAENMASILHNLLLYPNEKNRKKGLAKIALYPDYSNLPSFHHESITSASRRLIKGQPKDTNAAAKVFKEFALNHGDPNVESYIRRLEEHMFNGLTIPCLTTTLKREFVSYYDQEHQLHCAYSPIVGLIGKWDAISISTALAQGQEFLSLNSRVPPLPPRSSKEGTFIAIFSNMPTDIVRTDSLKWNDRNPPPGETKKSQRTARYHLMQNTEGDFIDSDDAHRDVTVENWNATHPRVHRLRKQVISVIDVDGNSCGPHVVVWTWDSSGDDHPRPSPHKNSKKNKNNYQKNHRSAVTEARATLINKPIPPKHLYQTFNSQGKCISMRAVKTASVLARPIDANRDNRTVRTDGAALLNYLESLEGTQYARFLSTRDNPEDVVNLVVLDTRMASVAAKGQLSESQLKNRRRKVEDAIAEGGIGSFIKNKHIDNSGVFVKNSGAWVMDTTYGLSDYFITMIAFESSFFRTTKSQKRVWLPLAYIAHKQEDGPFFLKAFREFYSLLERHCPELADKKAACLITDDEPAFQEIFKIPLFNGAAHMLCDFHFLRNAKSHRTRYDESSEDDESDSESNKENNSCLKSGFSKALFGTPERYGDSPEEITKFRAGAVWAQTADELRESLQEKYEDNMFSKGELNYGLKNANKLFEKHGAYPRLMSGRLTLFVTSNHIENMNRRLKEHLHHKRTVLQNVYKKLHEYFSMQYEAMVFAAKGQPGYMELSAEPVIPIEEMDDDDLANHFEQNGLLRPDVLRNFEPPVPTSMITALAGKKTTKFVKEHQDYWDLNEVKQKQAFFIFPKDLSSPATTVTMKKNILHCESNVCGKKICIHIIMALVLLPVRLDRRIVASETEKAYLSLDKRLYNAKKKGDGIKPGQRTFSQLSVNNRRRPILDSSSSFLCIDDSLAEESNLSLSTEETALSHEHSLLSSFSLSSEQTSRPTRRRRSFIGMDTSVFLPVRESVRLKNSAKKPRMR